MDFLLPHFLSIHQITTSWDDHHVNEMKLLLVAGCFSATWSLAFMLGLPQFSDTPGISCSTAKDRKSASGSYPTSIAVPLNSARLAAKCSTTIQQRQLRPSPYRYWWWSKCSTLSMHYHPANLSWLYLCGTTWSSFTQSLCPWPSTLQSSTYLSCRVCFLLYLSTGTNGKQFSWSVYP